MQLADLLHERLRTTSFFVVGSGDLDLRARGQGVEELADG